MTARQVTKDLNEASDKAKSVTLARFFKTGPGEYGEGDRFLGVTVPKQRIIAKKYQDLPFSEVKKLLISPWHEHRLTGLLILTYRFSVSEMAQKREIFDFYLVHTERINNWDLVDVTAPGIVGEYLVESGSDSGLLRRLAKSQSLWERRIAIVSTFAWIRRGKYQECFEIAEILLYDSHDLIQKAVGWMLREVGKRCGTESLRDFLDRHACEMPRTMLRYAIERFPENVRQAYLRKK
jgi:3-methyladenine DNA glycosylase AlkD